MVDFQASSSAQGRKFEDAVETILRTEGCKILAAHFADPVSHEEIDLIIETPSGTLMWLECKGSWNVAKKNIPGLKRSDTSKKAVATAWHLRASHGDAMPPYLLVTSHMPNEGSYSDDLLTAAQAHGLFAGVVAFTDLPDWLRSFDQDGSARRVTGDSKDVDQ
ncbi:MAG: hypothetical protein WEE36_02440 [Acidimicrobiia bacterium]